MTHNNDYQRALEQMLEALEDKTVSGSLPPPMIDPRDFTNSTLILNAFHMLAYAVAGEAIEPNFEGEELFCSALSFLSLSLKAHPILLHKIKTLGLLEVLDGIRVNLNLSGETSSPGRRYLLRLCNVLHHAVNDNGWAESQLAVSMMQEGDEIERDLYDDELAREFFAHLVKGARRSDFSYCKAILSRPFEHVEASAPITGFTIDSICSRIKLVWKSILPRTAIDDIAQELATLCKAVDDRSPGVALIVFELTQVQGATYYWRILQLLHELCTSSRIPTIALSSVVVGEL